MVWTEDEMTALELPSSTTNLGWDAGRLVSMTPGAVSGSYLFEYEHNGDPQRLARVTVPGGATLDIVTAADGGTTRIEVPGQRIDVAYTSSTRVDVTMTPGTAPIAYMTPISRVRSTTAIVIIEARPSPPIEASKTAADTSILTGTSTWPTRAS